MSKPRDLADLVSAGNIFAPAQGGFPWNVTWPTQSE